MRETAQVGVMGMLMGTLGGYIFLMRSCGKQEFLSPEFVPIVLGSLFIGLVVGVFSFLFTMAFSRKDK